jgi:hypothetical protein
MQGLVIHPPDHEHLTGVELLGYRWQQTIRVAA